jgi:hypothetical protein
MTDCRCDERFSFSCAVCGETVSCDQDLLYCGCVLTCPKCGADTVVELHSRSRFAAHCQELTRVRQALEEAAKSVLEYESSVNDIRSRGFVAEVKRERESIMRTKMEGAIMGILIEKLLDEICDQGEDKASERQGDAE